MAKDTPKRRSKQSSSSSSSSSPNIKEKVQVMQTTSPINHLLPPTPVTVDPTPRRRSSRFTPTAQPSPLAPPPPPLPPHSSSLRSRKSLKFVPIQENPHPSPSKNATFLANQELGYAKTTAESCVLLQPTSPSRVETRRKRKFSEENNVGIEQNGNSTKEEVKFSEGKNVDTEKILKGTRKKTKRNAEKNVIKEKNGNETKKKTQVNEEKDAGIEKIGRNRKKVYYRKAMYDGGVFSVGDDVYVKRREDASSDEEDPEIEECRVCFKPAGRRIMIECDDCLGGFHLKCLKPPLREVPEGDWICGFCEVKKTGKVIELPVPPPGKKRSRTAKEKLLSSDLWAAHIESLWKEVDGTYWFRARWYIIPEETVAGRQPHNLRREIYRTNDFADVEMESVIRHCYVMNPKEFSKANNEGDDVFMCEYEYDIRWHSFKRLADIDNSEESDEEADNDGDWTYCKDLDSDIDDDIEYEEEDINRLQTGPSPTLPLAANSRRGRIFGLQKIGVKNIPKHVRCHKQTELEKAKATLLLASMPKSLPCRDKEMDEIAGFIKGAVCDNHCLGRCLYIHGVPGTGKTMSVLAVMRSLKSEVDAGSINPYCFVEINGLKLASPENIYSVIYEALTGYRVSWKKALHFLNDGFSSETNCRKEDNQPCVLLIDELDILVTRNQSVLYNILDWPTKPHSKLIVIGIANTMDLPEKLLPRISSRMGIQRLCFGPYNYQQLQEIISSRLKGIDAFEKPAIEFASRKVAAVSGDARRALEICRRAAELADYRAKKMLPPSNSDVTGNTLVGMADIDAAIQEMFQAPHVQVMRNGSKLSKIFLAAMVYVLHKTGMGDTTFENLAMAVSCICTSNKEEFPGWDALMRIGCKLGECRIVLCEAGVKHKLQKLQLNFPSDDVAFALKDSRELPWLAKYL